MLYVRLALSRADVVLTVVPMFKKVEKRKERKSEKS
jgi:hypothetical protein